MTRILSKSFFVLGGISFFIAAAFFFPWFLSAIVGGHLFEFFASLWSNLFGVSTADAIFAIYFAPLIYSLPAAILSGVLLGVGFILRSKYNS